MVRLARASLFPKHFRYSPTQNVQISVGICVWTLWSNSPTGPYFIHSFIQGISCLSSLCRAPSKVWRRYCLEWKCHKDTSLPPQTVKSRAGMQRWSQEICTIIWGYQLPPSPVFSYQRLLNGMRRGYLSPKTLCLERKSLLLRGACAVSEEPPFPLCSSLRWLLGPVS